MAHFLSGTQKIGRKCRCNKGERDMFNSHAMTELRKLLEETFPDDIENVILFGSRARGTAREHSDYDILVVLSKPCDWKLKNRIYDTTWEIDFKYDILTDIRVISKSDLGTVRGKQPSVSAAFRDGVIL